MMHTSRVLMSFLATFALSACSTAQFSSGNANRAKSISETGTSSDQCADANADAASCAANPDDPASGPTSDTDGDTPGAGGVDTDGDSGSASNTSTSTSTSPDICLDPNGCEPTPAPVCTNDLTGVNVALLIDNSNSHSATDCPSPAWLRRDQGVDLYACNGVTNRERAALAAYDVLAQVAGQQPERDLAMSRMAIASFPTASDHRSGWQKDTDGFIDIAGNGRNAIAQAMQFARKPYGMTPYDAAMAAGSDLFGSLQDKERARLAVLITDGEPTDGDPFTTSKRAEALRKAGVTVVTVFVTGSHTRSQREADHIAMLRRFDDNSLSTGNGHWYNSRYASFDAYVRSLLGNSSEAGLVRAVSSLVDPSCVDAPGKLCQRQLVEVQNSAALEKVLTSVVKKAVRCVP